MLFILFIVIAAAGGGVIKLSAGSRLDGQVLQSPHPAQDDKIMVEIKVLCEDLFESEIIRITDPVVENIQQDFSRGISWLWEDRQDFVDRVEKFVGEYLPLPALINSLDDEQAKLVKNLNKALENLALLLEEIKSGREQDFLNLKQLVNLKVDDLKKTLRNEQDIFYDYVYKLIQVQIRNQEQDEEFDIAEYFNDNKLGEQFCMNLSQSLEARLLVLQDLIIRELESFAADVVGKMQNNALQLMNNFKNINEVVPRLIEESRDEDNTILIRLQLCLNKAGSLQDEAEEIMLTLAWQDILVEKRWQDVQQKLFSVKDKVNENVDEDVLNYISSILETEVPAFAGLVKTSDNAVFYKSLLDAELVYQLFEGEKLTEVIKNGVYSLLQFIRPLDILVKKSVRLSEEGSNKRKLVKARIKLDSYQSRFDKVREVMENRNRALAAYLEEIYPKAFYTFCNNPYIKQKPENLNQAAWCLFLDLNDDSFDETIYFLVGLLLIIHQLRNEYIHPFKPLPLDLEDGDEIGYMRYAAYQAIEILLSIDLKKPAGPLNRSIF